MTHTQNRRCAFPLGQIVITRTAQATLNQFDVVLALKRHANGDWGECSPEDTKTNNVSLREGFRLLSVYRDRNENRFWIITEADRSATTILLPEEY